jgi:glycosyltransferase involved in cell wall biosynthesis
MKLACISTSTVPSGTANSIQALKVCQSLAQTGAEVRLWLPGGQAAAWPALAEQYGLVTRLPITWLWANPGLRRYDFAARAVWAARRWGAEAVYTWVPQAALLALWLGLPTLMELHDRPTGRLGPWLLRQVAQHPGKKRLLFITRALQGALERERGIRARDGEALIAPDGVDLERYQNLPSPTEARRRLSLPEGLTAGYTGHLYAGRGVETLAALARAYPQVQFLWVGGRPDDVAIWRTRLGQMGVANVTLTGFIPNQKIPLYQAAAEILLMPYEQQVAVSGGGNTADICSPMKMFEYMATGRAILSSNLPVLHEVLDARTAVFCPPEDTRAWIDAFGRLLDDRALRERLGGAARAEVARYAWIERARRSLAGF